MNNYDLPSETTTKIALSWILGIFNELNLPYQIVGGLAAKAYGAKRPLVDIDILMPLNCLNIVAEKVAQYLVYEPKHHLSERWDMTYMALKYGDQRLEIGDGENSKIFDVKSQSWIPHVINFNDFEVKNVFGIDARIMPKHKLIKYKSILGREVDLKDLLEMD